MKTKLQKVVDHRRRISTKESELTKEIALLKKYTMEAIFEVLGVKVVVGDNYLNHHSGGLSVAYREGSPTTPTGFEVQCNINEVVIITTVSDESSSRLITFKELLNGKYK